MVAPCSMKSLIHEKLPYSAHNIRYVEAKLSGESEDILGCTVQWVRAYNIDKPFHEKESDWVGFVVANILLMRKRLRHIQRKSCQRLQFRPIILMMPEHLPLERFIRMKCRS